MVNRESTEGLPNVVSSKANNRPTKTLNGVTDTYNNNNVDELTSITEGGTAIKSYTYDSAGRTKTVTTSAGETDLDYDYEGRLTQITYPDTSTNTFACNGLDTRVSNTDSSGTASYMRDGAAVTDPVINDGSANYTPGISVRSSGASKFVAADELGSTTALADSSQTITDTRQYDAFGMLVSSTGSTKTPFGFAGEHGYQTDVDSGLMLLGHRYYDPSAGRFLTRDPAKSGRNWFAYAGNNGVRNVDASGLDDPDGDDGGDVGDDGTYETEVGIVSIVESIGNGLRSAGNWIRERVWPENPEEITKALGEPTAKADGDYPGRGRLEWNFIDINGNEFTVVRESHPYDYDAERVDDPYHVTHVLPHYRLEYENDAGIHVHTGGQFHGEDLPDEFPAGTVVGWHGGGPVFN